MAFLFCCIKGGGSDRKDKGKKQPSWRIFSLKELHAATNNFNYDNKLGEGGFGSVYWGQLWDGSQIAVKRLKVWSNKAEMEFAVEVEILARVRHKNLLSLRGYCAEGQERLIVYDYMPNLSLLSHLHGQHSAECLLDWNRRMNIAIGSAEGIAYVSSQPGHTPYNTPRHQSEQLNSTLKRSIADWALPLARERKFDDIADPRLDGKYVEVELKRVVLVALVCAHHQPEQRPTIVDVLELLKGESNEKMGELENHEMLKATRVSDYNDGQSVDSSDYISEEKDSKVEAETEEENVIQVNAENS
ncbi:hypothetical protein ACFE04_031542 [Oxalis oulophora]